MTISVSLRGRLALCAVALAWLLTAEMALAAPPIQGDSVTAGNNGAATSPGMPSTPPATAEPTGQSPGQVSATEGSETGAQNAAKPPQPAQPIVAAPQIPRNLETVRPDEVTTVLGQKVRGPDGKDILGPIIDVLVDGDGKPRAAIIDFGGFLGVGVRKIAVDWRLLKFKAANHDAPISLSLDRAQIQAAPEYKDQTQPAEIVGPPPPAPASADAGSQAN